MNKRYAQVEEIYIRILYSFREFAKKVTFLGSWRRQGGCVWWGTVVSRH